MLSGFSIASFTHNECCFSEWIEDAENYKMVMACAMGFNFNTKIGTDTFNEYLSLLIQMLIKRGISVNIDHDIIQ